MTRKEVWPLSNKWKYPDVDNIITVSNSFKKLLISKSNITSRHCHFIPEQFDLNILKPAIKRFNDVAKKDKINISIFRRFDKGKIDGVIKILQIFSKWKDNLNNYEINLYGGGDSEEYLLHMVKKMEAIGLNINYVGFVKNIYSYMKEADLVIGSERVGIESTIIGIPCLIIDDDGIIDFVTIDNILHFIDDNFSGNSFEEDNKRDINFIMEAILNMGRLMEKISLDQCSMIASKRYDAKVGLKKLVSLSIGNSKKEDRFEKLIKITLSIFHMYLIQTKYFFIRRIILK